jgi:hypothetical protein
MTRIAYLLLVHEQPKQAALLVRALVQEHSFLFIHVDSRSDQKSFVAALQQEGCSENVQFVENRVSGLWGHFSLVEATLRLLKEAIAHEGSFHHFVLLSGQDFPLKSNRCIHDFLGSNAGCDFIEHYALPSERLSEKQGGLYRVNRFHHISAEGHREFPPYSKKPVLNTLFNLWAKLHHNTVRKMPLNMQLRAGSQWWALCRSSVVGILSFLEGNKDVEKFFRNVWIPDEIFFQTVLFHLKTDHACIINDNFRFTEWEPQNGSNFIIKPKNFTERDLPQLQKTDALFARKFDEIQSRGIVQQLLRLRMESGALAGGSES